MESYIKKINNIEKLILDDKILIAKEKLQELKSNIIYDMAMKNLKGNKNNKDQLKYAKQLLKNSYTKNENRPLFHKIYKVDDTFQLCDGFTAIVLNNMIDGLELNTEKGDYLDCRKIIKSCNPTGYEYQKEKIDMLELEQQAIKIKKIKDIPIPLENIGKIKNTYYNPMYLLWAIKILGTTNVNIYFNNSNPKEPIYLKSELGEAIVLPIKQPKN